MFGSQKKKSSRTTPTFRLDTYKEVIANFRCCSKTALNWFVRRLHFEEPWLTSFVFHPGLVETDMTANVTAGSGLSLKDLGGISVETSVAGMTKTIDSSTRETSGTFQNYDGAVNPW